MNEKMKVLIVLVILMMVTVYQIGQAGAQVNLEQPVRAQQLEENNEMNNLPEADEVEVHDTAIRIRIIPNSNAYQDQLAKRMTRFAIDEFLATNEAHMQTVDGARQFLMSSLGDIEARVSQVFQAIKYDVGFQVSYGNHFFPEKRHNGEVFPAGYYESLVIKIGEGQGNNWWCFVNPGICLGPNSAEVNGETSGHWNTQYQTMNNTQTAIQTQNFTSYISNFVGNLFSTSQNTPEITTAYVATTPTVEFDWYLFDDER